MYRKKKDKLEGGKSLRDDIEILKRIEESTVENLRLIRRGSDKHSKKRMALMVNDEQPHQKTNAGV